MKKLLTITTVLFAGIFGTAQADVTVSGSAEVIAKSIGSKTIISNGGSVGFGLSTTLENGMTISNSGYTLETSTDVAETSSAAIDGADDDAFFITTFAMGGSSFSVGQDVEVDYADLDVGEVVSDNTSQELAAVASDWSEGDAKGVGFSFSTSMGGAAITVGHLMDNDPGGVQSNDINESGAVSASGVKVSLPIGPLSTTIGYHTDQTTASGVNATGVSAAYALPAGGTLSAAYQTSQSKTANADAVRISAKYATSLGDGTAVAVGYTSTDQDTKATTTDIEVTVSRSIGTGASLFLDFHNRTGTDSGNPNAGTSAVAVGTSVAF